MELETPVAVDDAPDATPQHRATTAETIMIFKIGVISLSSEQH